MSNELESALAEDEVNLARLRARYPHNTEAQLESRLTGCGGDVRYEHWSNCDLDPHHDGECLSGIEYADQLRDQLATQGPIIAAATALVEDLRSISRTEFYRRLDALEAVVRGET